MSSANTSFQLNPQQQQAVECIEGPLLVIAGAGSGKTRVVTERIFRLLELGVPASAILAVTFTNKAAGEMRERIQQHRGQKVTVSTFHGLGAQILRECSEVLGFGKQLVIYDEEDSLRALRSCLQDLAVDDRKEVAKALRAMISHAKNALRGPHEIDESDLRSEVEQLFPAVYAEYQQRLKLSAAVDFDDLLFLSVRVLQDNPDLLEQYQNRWSFFSVDEFQDTNAAQYRMIRLLAGKSNNLCVVGDPDQSIYSWRGADISNILEFTRDYPESQSVQLEQNYRSTDTILQAANGLIQYNDGRLEKDLWSAQGDGDPVQICACQTERAEAEFVVESIRKLQNGDHLSLKNVAIFYRTNFQSRVFEDVLLREEIPYVIYGGISFYQRKEIKDVLAYLRVAFSPADTVAFARTINLPKRGIGEKTVAKILVEAVEADEPILHYCQKLLRGDLGAPKITTRLRNGLDSYLSIISQLQQLAQVGLTDAVRGAIENTGIIESLRADPVTFDDRKGNLEELLSKAMEWEEERDGAGLGEFLEELALKSSADKDDPDVEHLSLMTLHNSKGLEFDTCFMVGLEEGLFPHFNVRDDEQGLEEERRLCYVGMTRARRHLTMSYAASRVVYGSHRSMPKSRFLSEIPDRYVERKGHAYLGDGGRVAAKLQKTHEEYEHAAELDPHECCEGDRVVHSEFGVGTIKRIYEGQLGLSFEVHFTSSDSTRNLAVRYAQLRLFI